MFAFLFDLGWGLLEVSSEICGSRVNQHPKSNKNKIINWTIITCKFQFTFGIYIVCSKFIQDSVFSGSPGCHFEGVSSDDFRWNLRKLVMGQGLQQISFPLKMDTYFCWGAGWLWKIRRFQMKSAEVGMQNSYTQDLLVVQWARLKCLWCSWIWGPHHVMEFLSIGTFVVISSQTLKRLALTALTWSWAIVFCCPPWRFPKCWDGISCNYLIQWKMDQVVLATLLLMKILPW